MTKVTEEKNTNQCDTLGILAIIFWVLAWIPIIGWAFLAAAIALWIISVAQNGKKAVCGIIGIVLSWLVIISKIVILVWLFSFGSRWIKMIMQEIPTAVAQESLPELVQYIEEYKTNFGEYPDTLLQLDDLSEEAMDSTMDPFKFKDVIAKAIVWWEDMTEDEIRDLIPQYHYEKLENGYYLFSNGVDGKAFTDDDIFPDMTYITIKNNLQLP